MTDYDLEPEDYEYKEEIDFNEVIDALLDADTSFPPRYLSRLADLPELELEQLTETWPKIDEVRRQRLLEDLEILADETYLDFDALFLLGLEEALPASRLVSIRGLWECENPAVARKLLPIANNDPENEVRAQAARCLGHFVYLGEFEEISASLYSKVSEVLKELYTAGPNESIRQGALESLGFSSSKVVDSFIEAALETDKESWLQSALIAIGRSANDEWSPNVIANLHHDDTDIRAEAARAAGLLSAQQAVSHLLQLIDDPEEEVKQSAIWALSEIGGLDARAAIEGLRNYAEDEDEIEFLDEALENLNFTEMAINFDLLDLSEEDLRDMLDDEDASQEIE
jgi:HEAT repeat protein